MEQKPKKRSKKFLDYVKKVLFEKADELGGITKLETALGSATYRKFMQNGLSEESIQRLVTEGWITEEVPRKAEKHKMKYLSDYLGETVTLMEASDEKGLSYLTIVKLIKESKLDVVQWGKRYRIAANGKYAAIKPKEIAVLRRRVRELEAGYAFILAALATQQILFSFMAHEQKLLTCDKKDEMQIGDGQTLIMKEKR